MFEMFSTREIALGIYLFLLIFYIFINKKVRSSAIVLMKVALRRQLLVPFCIIWVYAIIFIYTVSNIELWNWYYIKDVLIWVIFMGIPICFKAIDRNTDNRYFFNIIFNNFKFIAIVEFLISNFTFALWIELLLQFILLLVYMMQAIAERKEEYKPAKKLIDIVIAIISLFIIIATFKIALNTYSEHNISEYVISFIIPVVLSIIYVPVAYMMAIYSRYEMLFIRMKFKEPKTKKIIRQHRLAVIKNCRLSIKRIIKFERTYMPKMYVNMNQEEFEKILYDFKNNI